VTKHRVLVVDDYPDAAETAVVWFALQGHDCRAVHTAKQALDESLSFVPTIALIDIGLPDRNGLDLASDLRGRFGTDLFIAAFTAWTQPDVARRAFEVGCDHYIVKPASPSKLHLMLWLAEPSRRAARTQLSS